MVNDYKPGEWDLPGGTIEFGEDPIKALRREVKEETNLDVKVTKPLFVFSFVSSPTRHQFQIVYECKYLSGRVVLNPEEHDRFVWINMVDIKKFKKIAFLNEFFKQILKEHS